MPKCLIITSHKKHYKKCILFWEAFNLYTLLASNLKGKQTKNIPCIVNQHDVVLVEIDSLICLNLAFGKMHILVEPKNISSALKRKSNLPQEVQPLLQRSSSNSSVSGCSVAQYFLHIQPQIKGPSLLTWSDLPYISMLLQSNW